MWKNIKFYNTKEMTEREGTAEQQQQKTHKGRTMQDNATKPPLVEKHYSVG